MPLLTDIAMIQLGKQVVTDTKKGMYALRGIMTQPELSLASKLRTSLTVGSEAKLGKLSLPSTNSKGVYASWRSELERTPVYDLCEHKPLNQVKDTDKEDLQAFIRERKHKEWLEEVDARLKKLGFKK